MHVKSYYFGCKCRDLVSLLCWRRRRGHRKWTSLTQEWAKMSSTRAGWQPVLERKMSLCVLFVLVGWFVSSEVVSRHCRGKRVTSVRLQPETLTPSPRAASQDHISLQTLHSKQLSVILISITPWTGSCVLFYKYTRPCMSVQMTVRTGFTVLFSSSPWIEVRCVEIFSQPATLLCCGVYLSFCRLVLMFKR